MQRFIAGILALLCATLPAGAVTRHHHGMVRHSGEAGLPITAEPDSIRINAAGQVLSQPVPAIQKEKDFDSRAQRDLAHPRPAPGAPPQPAPGAAPQKP